jgi:hypothetical protein
MTEPVSVTHYVDATGNDCYRVCLTESEVCSTVSSAHLIEERKVQLQRIYSGTTP